LESGGEEMNEFIADVPFNIGGSYVGFEQFIERFPPIPTAVLFTT